MEKDDLVYVGHMLDTARKAIELVHGKSREDFDHDEALSLALTHLLQVIGEAARRVSRDYAERHADIPWRAIIGMRHKVVHDYLLLTRMLCGDVVTGDLKPLVSQLAGLLQGE